MPRTFQATTFETPAVAAQNLSRLLSRLDQKLRPTQSAPSAIERAKITANLEYARQLLHTLEADSATISVPSRRHMSLTDLGSQKQAIRRLNEKLQTAATETDEAETTDFEEETLADDAPATLSDDDYASLKKMKAKPKTAVEFTATFTPMPTTAVESTPTLQPIATPELRNRKTTREGQRSELFGATATTTGAKQNGKLTKATEMVGTEALLDMQRSEQENITEDLLKMAKLLKESSLTFGAHLESEKGYLDAAKMGLDRNAAGLTTAGNNMDSLRKNDNISFIWSSIYMAVIMILVFLTLFVLFFAPKLRWW